MRFLKPLLLGLALSVRALPQETDVVERLFHSGERAYAAKSHAEALESWGQVLQQAPRSPFAAQALYRMAQHHADARNPQAALPLLDRLKAEHLRGAEPLAKVAFDAKLQVVQHALGTHTTIARVQGNKLKAKREIRVASLFKNVPEDFLKMITVHELAHMKERQHDKAFYSLCNYMEPRYHQLEFEVRVYLTHLEASGARLWDATGS